MARFKAARVASGSRAISFGVGRIRSISRIRLLGGEKISKSGTHIGQIAMLRRIAGEPIKGENYSRAKIEAGRVGAEQDKPKREFD